MHKKSLRDNGVIVTDIIDDLTARGILNQGKPFARNTVHLMLKNEKYSGVYHHNGEEFTDTYPRIVPEHIFEIVQQKIKEPKEMLELLIKRITVYDDRIEITYNCTDNKKGPDHRYRDFLLCEKSFYTPLYEIKTAKTLTQTVKVFVYF